MAVQKQAVLELVETHHREGRTVSEVLGVWGWRDRVITAGKREKERKRLSAPVGMS